MITVALVIIVTSVSVILITKSTTTAVTIKGNSVETAGKKIKQNAVCDLNSPLSFQVRIFITTIMNKQLMYKQQLTLIASASMEVVFVLPIFRVLICI